VNDASKGNDGQAAAARRGGLCPYCQNVKLITSAKGSTFLLCQLSSNDPRFPKYPPQPVARCSGFAERVTGAT
jgi:hypothetical protein